MTVEIVAGDLFECDAEALVNAVNCVGVMGRGIALEFKKRYPENFKLYSRCCRDRLLQPGTVLVCSLGLLLNPRFIINVPTKRHWRDKSLLADIEAGLDGLAKEAKALSLKSIAMPALGCGLGGLDWDVVRDLVESVFGESDTQVMLFAPR